MQWRHRDTGREETRPVRNVFLFLGADPATDWLKDCGVTLDDKGFVRTGSGRAPLETSVPGVFAVGDVRDGAIRRVANSVGEGSIVLYFIRQYMRNR